MVDKSKPLYLILMYEIILELKSLVNKIVEVKNSKQTVRILVPSGNKLIDKVMSQAYLLEVIENTPKVLESLPKAEQ